MLVSDIKIPLGCFFGKSTAAQNKEQKVERGANIFLYAAHAVLTAPSSTSLPETLTILFALIKSKNFQVIFIMRQTKFKHCERLFFRSETSVCNISSPLTLCSICKYISGVSWLISLLVPPFCIIHRTFHILWLCLFCALMGQNP